MLVYISYAYREESKVLKFNSDGTYSVPKHLSNLQDRWSMTRVAARSHNLWPLLSRCWYYTIVHTHWSRVIKFPTSGLIFAEAIQLHTLISTFYDEKKRQCYRLREPCLLADLWITRCIMVYLIPAVIRHCNWMLHSASLGRTRLCIQLVQCHSDKWAKPIMLLVTTYIL